MGKHKIPEEILKSEKRLVKQITKSFTQLAKIVSAAVAGGDIHNDALIQLSFEKLVPQIAMETKKVYERGGKKLSKAMDLKIDSGYIIQEAINHMQWKKSQLLGTSKQSITQTTKNIISKILTKGIESGKSYTELGKMIQDQTEEGIFSQARAQLIAVRESGEAYEIGRQTTLKKYLTTNGEQAEKIWDTVNDSKVTDQCRENEAQGRILFDQPFRSGDMEAPRNSNPRCRCTTNYKII